VKFIFPFFFISVNKSDEGHTEGHSEAFPHCHREWKVHRQGTFFFSPPPKKKEVYYDFGQKTDLEFKIFF